MSTLRVKCFNDHKLELSLNLFNYYSDLELIFVDSPFYSNSYAHIISTGDYQSLTFTIGSFDSDLASHGDFVTNSVSEITDIALKIKSFFFNLDELCNFFNITLISDEEARCLIGYL